MSRTSSQRTYQTRHIPSYRLEELFDDEDLTLKLLVAKYRIVTAFDHATFWSHGKQRGTDNFIVGVGSRQKDLVQHVMERVVIGKGRGIVTASELPEFVGNASSTLRQLARITERQLIAVQLAMLHPKSIWFNIQPPGTWNITPSLMDEYRLNRRLTHEAKKVDSQLRKEGRHGGGRLIVVH